MNRAILGSILVAVIGGFGLSQATKPNLSGTWERVAIGGAGNPGSESMMITHNEPHIYVLYRIKDDAGVRTLDLKGMTDGRLHPQEVEGQPAVFMAWWDGQSLILDIQREAGYGYTHNRRKIAVSSDSKTFSVERTQYLQDGTLRGTGTERWEKK
jgi:hypothetical protein